MNSNMGPAGSMTAHAPFWTEHETALFLRLSVSTLRAWRLRRVGVPFSKFGGRVRYEPARVVRWASEQERPCGGDMGNGAPVEGGPRPARGAA
jgi:hypothetical protein